MQQQYSRRECIEIVGISKDIEKKNLENHVITIFSKVGINLTNRDFHAVHRLYDESTIIVRFINRKDALSILTKRKKLRELNKDEKNDLSVDGKLYINESLCGAYRVLLGKCNALFKSSRIHVFFTINGKIKIGGQKSDKGEWVNYEEMEITHITDLEKRFGKRFIDTLIKRKK